MILKTGTWKDDNTGEIRDRYLIIGRVMKTEMKTVGQRNTSMLSVALSPGRGEDLITVKLWGYDAQDYNGLQKFSTIMIDAYEESREYNERTYTDYIPLNIIACDPPRAAAPARRKRSDPVQPQDPMAGFTDINTDDLPF